MSGQISTRAPFVVGVGLIALVAFGLFVWPTPYRYDHIHYEGKTSVVRINRITGGAKELGRYGWRQIGNSQPDWPLLVGGGLLLLIGMRLGWVMLREKRRATAEVEQRSQQRTQTTATNHVAGEEDSATAIMAGAPPSPPPVLSNGQGQTRGLLLPWAVALAVGGVVMAVLLAVVLLLHEMSAYHVGQNQPGLSFLHWLIISAIIGSFGFGVYQLGKSLRAGNSMVGEERVRPWIRFWARLFDTWSATLLTGLILGFVYPHAAEWNELLLGMALFFAYCCFIEPILFALLGTTPGKALLAIDVRTQSGNRLSFGQAMNRSIGVWFYGWGMGIPFVQLVTLPMAHSVLTIDKITTWDRKGNYRVSHGRIGRSRGSIATVLIVGLLLLLVNLNSIAENQRRNQILGSVDSFSKANARDALKALGQSPQNAPTNVAKDSAVVSAIHYAVRARAKQAVRALVQQNPRCLLEMEGDSAGFTPLHTACERGFQDMADLLLALGADVNVRARNGETPLITAVAERGKDNQSLALFFIASGADVKAANDDGWTALHYAANENMPTLAQALIDKGAAADAKTVEGETPLDIALKQHSQEVVQVLLKNSAKIRDSAISEYTKAIGLNPKDAAAYVYRGMAYDSKGDNDAAIADYTQAIRFDPKDAKVHYDRALAYGKKGNDDAAIADFTESIRLNPKDANAHYYRALAYVSKRDNDMAIADCTQAIRLDPMHSLAYFSRGSAYLRKGLAYEEKGNYDKAITDYTEAIRLDPNDAAAHYFRGVAYKAKGESAKAATDFDQAKRLGYKSQ